MIFLISKMVQSLGAQVGKLTDFWGLSNQHTSSKNASYLLQSLFHCVCVCVVLVLIRYIPYSDTNSSIWAREYSFIGSLHNAHNIIGWPTLKPEIISHKLNQGFPHGCQGHNYLSHHHWLPGCAAEGSWSKELSYGPNPHTKIRDMIIPPTDITIGLNTCFTRFVLYVIALEIIDLIDTAVL